MNINELIAAIRAWQAAYAAYRAAVEEAPNKMTPRRREAREVLDVAAMGVTLDEHNDHVLAVFVALADECERLSKRAQSLRITLWETERDARTALKLLEIKNYENVGNMCELIAESVNDALKIDTERE